MHGVEQDLLKAHGGQHGFPGVHDGCPAAQGTRPRQRPDGEDVALQLGLTHFAAMPQSAIRLFSWNSDLERQGLGHHNMAPLISKQHS